MKPASLTLKHNTSLHWIVWGVFSTAFFLSFFHRVSPAVMVDYLMLDFSVGAVVIGGLSSIYFYIYLIMQIPTGLLADSIGPNKTIIVGSLVTALGSLIFALSNSIEMAFIGRFFIGLGVSVAFICMLKIQTLWFRPEQFGLLMGALTLVGTIASVSAASPLAVLADFYGWRPLFLVAALLSLLSAVACYLMDKQAPAPFFAKDSQNQNTALSLAKSMPIVWKNAQTWLCSLIHFAFLGSYLTFVGLWGIPYFMQSYGMDRLTAANWMIVFSLIYTAGAFFYGALSDNWLKQRKIPLVMSSFLFILALTNVSIAPTDKESLTIILISFGILCFVSSSNIICFAVAKESNPTAASGLAMATANGGILGAAILQPLIGYILDSRWQGELINGVKSYSAEAYKAGFISLLVVGAMAFIASLLIKETFCKNTYHSSH